jgi:HSP20 family molecular chaperone IbpA
LRTNLGQLVEDKINIKAEVRDSVLYIDVPGNLPREAIADFTISAPELRKITVYGASKIETIDEHILQQPNLTLDLNGAAEAELNLAVKELHIEAKGASKLELEGQVDAARISLAGAGKVDAEDLVVQTMHINCAGASQAEIHVVRELWAQAAGASRINYSGNPTIKQKMAVGGSVVVRD